MSAESDKEGIRRASKALWLGAVALAACAVIAVPFPGVSPGGFAAGAFVVALIAIRVGGFSFWRR